MTHTVAQYVTLHSASELQKAYLQRENKSAYIHLAASNGFQDFATQNGIQDGVLEWNGKTFLIYFGDDRDIWAVVYDHRTQAFSDPVEIADGHTADDTHQFASAVIDDKGFIHIGYGCHGTALYYKKSTNPGDVSAWPSETTLASYATYPKWVKDASGNLYLFYREGTGLEANHRYWRYRKSTNNGATFATAVTLVDSGNNAIWVYGTIGIDATDTIHTTWTYRTSGGSNDPTEFEGIYYAKTADGGTTWTESDGTPYSLPITPATDEAVTTGTKMLGMGITGDEYGNPLIVWVFSDLADYFETNQIHFGYLSGAVWQDDTLDSTGYIYGRPKIVVDGSVFYIIAVEVVGSYKEVILLRSLDNGATWTKYYLTSGSTADNRNICIKHNSISGIEFMWENDTNVWYSNQEWINQYLTTNPDNTDVTLDSNADAFLSLTGQEIGVDSQSINRVLASPSSGGAGVLTVRALVAADIPIITTGKISDFTSAVNALIAAAPAASGEILIQDGSSAPPVMLTNEAEDDFLYEG